MTDVTGIRSVHRIARNRLLERITTDGAKERGLLDISQREMAAIIGVSQGYVSLVESGKAIPSFETASAYCTVLDEKAKERASHQQKEACNA